VRWAVDYVFVNANLRLEFPFLPTPRCKRTIDRCRNFAFPTAPDSDVAFANPEFCKDRDDIVPFFLEISSQNGRCVSPLVKFVIPLNETRGIAQAHGADLLRCEPQIQQELWAVRGDANVPTRNVQHPTPNDH
jgi:hypothetical protein